MQECRISTSETDETRGADEAETNHAEGRRLAAPLQPCLLVRQSHQLSNWTTLLAAINALLAEKELEFPEVCQVDIAILI